MDIHKSPCQELPICVGTAHPESGMQTCTREWSLTLCKAPWLGGGQPVTLSSSAPASTCVPRPWEKDCASTAGTTQPPHSEGSLVTQSITLKTTGGFQKSREQCCCFLGMTNRFGLLNKFSAKPFFLTSRTYRWSTLSEQALKQLIFLSNSRPETNAQGIDFGSFHRITTLLQFLNQPNNSNRCCPEITF